MLCISLMNYSQPCQNTVGGVNRGWVFDPNDFNFTAGAVDAQGQPTGYSALALRAGSGATATATVAGGLITAINVGSGGSNYPIAPTVVITGAGTGGAAVANIVGGVVVSITITNAGTGYSSAPTISFTNPGATLAGGGKLYPFYFYENTGEYTFDNPDTDTCSTKFSHTLVGQFLNISQSLNNYLNSLGQAGCCCGLGVIFELNSGVVLVMGEKFVGNTEQRRFKVKMSSKGGSGKKYEDFNGAEITLKGDFTRSLNTYTGGVASLLAFA